MMLPTIAPIQHLSGNTNSQQRISALLAVAAVMLAAIMAACSSTPTKNTSTPQPHDTVALETGGTAAATLPSYGQPQPYDPPGSTITTSRAIQPVSHTVRDFTDAGVWFGSNFAGARLGPVFSTSDSDFVAVVKPENAPINNSPWYAFKVWSRARRTIRLHLTYDGGSHRYTPAISNDGVHWRQLESSRVQRERTTGTATIWLDVSRDTLWVSARQPYTTDAVRSWEDSLSRLPFVRLDVIGTSTQGRPLRRLTIGEGKEGEVLIIGRQHPPEVTGAWALENFVEALTAQTPLAQAFRQRFTVQVVALVNPDGVDGGHWRHNAGGVDLNRDWFAFNQPETRAVRDAFLGSISNPNNVLFGLDFHSTWGDIFYTLDSTVTVRDPLFTERWIGRIEESVPGFTARIEPSDLESPIFKSWFVRQFGAPAVTYEMGEAATRQRAHTIGTAAAQQMMTMMVEKRAQ
ncbi:MAG: succinylglutamate desuccinylase/aspartoacylase family protein [Armatimonadetes bacterium]|nr:succinylglutamate desuccinylase/aspartoacylase family protein [Armatimonadota bacterium]